MNEKNSNYINLIRYPLYMVSTIAAVLTLINQKNLVYMLIAVMAVSIFEVFTELLSQNKNLIKIVINLIILTLFTFIYINIR
ncbi:hypothetical protein [Caloranaerobacter sp. DY30410]|uniref:hypothetical protein n=1 Tax=Caloranaerobacter sp. DY30410 TaxID=3238305 RepID=UPI003D057A40